jgi:hypothetical protein
MWLKAQGTPTIWRQASILLLFSLGRPDEDAQYLVQQDTQEAHMRSQT